MRRNCEREAQVRILLAGRTARRKCRRTVHALPQKLVQSLLITRYTKIMATKMNALKHTVVFLNDGETWTTISGCRVAVFDPDTFKEGAEAGSLHLRAPRREYDLSDPDDLRALADHISELGKKKGLK